MKTLIYIRHFEQNATFVELNFQYFRRPNYIYEPNREFVEEEWDEDN